VSQPSIYAIEFYQNLSDKQKEQFKKISRFTETTADYLLILQFFEWLATPGMIGRIDHLRSCLKSGLLESDPDEELISIIKEFFSWMKIQRQGE
jgi:hypothetical protein